ncbi:sulfotransferase domain-containing protein [Nereida sp. MMG025]|uniref:sulfotransferase domain-containing protein n=1 Tax=Nereida sp. MMG025 TaxID=2909981 RepID=UPI00351CB815|nr:sulfotransferase domain-containing protein [Nereida sp. MMG025]
MNISEEFGKYVPRRVVIAREQSLYWPTVLSQAVLMRHTKSICINGFQNSGTNWLCQMTSQYFDIPIFEAWHRWTPSVLGSHVLHMHRFVVTAPMNERTIYAVRDGRDTMVSRFFKAAASPRQSYLRRQIKEQAGFELDASKIKDQLADFIEWDFNHAKRASVNWAIHVRKAHEIGYPIVKFEALKEDAVTVLTPVFERLSGQEVNKTKLAHVVAACSFENMRGDKDNFHKRKGVAGEWKALFDQRSRAAFAKYAQAELELTGYEEGDQWVNA